MNENSIDFEIITFCHRIVQYKRIAATENGQLLRSPFNAFEMSKHARTHRRDGNERNEEDDTTNQHSLHANKYEAKTKRKNDHEILCVSIVGV